MRFATPRHTILLVLCALTAPARGVEEDRYGGDLSTYDFGAFGQPAASGQSGGYRSEAAPPANDLRSRPATQTPAAQRPATASPGTNPFAQPPSSSATLPTAPRPASGAPSAPPTSSATVRPLGGDPFGNLPPSPPPRTTTQASPPPQRAVTPSGGATNPFGAGAPFGSNAAPPSQGMATRPATPSYRESSVLQPGGASAYAGNGSTNPGASSAYGAQGASSLAGTRERQTREILEKMLRRPAESQLAGTPMPLASVVSSAGSREEQSRRVEAYWALTSAVADYYLGLAETRELARLRQQVSTFSTVLGEAQTKQGTRVETSLKAARAAQHRLAQLMGGGAMPLPSDTPFTGPYATRMESVFAGGVPEEARLIATLLPLRLVELQDAGDSVARSQKWIDRVANDQAARSDGEGVVMALELLALNRRAFVQIARDYNVQINRYAQLAAPERVDTGRLVGMLIRATGTPGMQPAQDPLMAGFSTGGATNSASRDFQPSGAARR